MPQDEADRQSGGPFNCNDYKNLFIRYDDGKNLKDELFSDNSQTEPKLESVIQATFRAQINDTETEILIDTGAATSVIASNLFNKIK